MSRAWVCSRVMDAESSTLAPAPAPATSAGGTSEPA